MEETTVGQLGLSLATAALILVLSQGLVICAYSVFYQVTNGCNISSCLLFISLMFILRRLSLLNSVSSMHLRMDTQYKVTW